MNVADLQMDREDDLSEALAEIAAHAPVLAEAGYVLDGLDGSPVLASAGYNAGPGRPQRWRETLAAPIEGEIFAEIIPFNETRDYVQRVMANTVNYAAVITGQSQSLMSKLQPIGPRAVTAQAPNPDLP